MRKPPPPRHRKAEGPAKVVSTGEPHLRPFGSSLRAVQIAAEGNHARGDELVAAALLMVRDELGSIALEMRELSSQLRTFKGILVLDPHGRARKPDPDSEESP